MILGKYGIYIVFGVIFIVLSIVNSAFFTKNNILNIVKQGSIVSIVAIGQTMCLITGGMDLSSGSIMALAGVTSASFGMIDNTNYSMVLLMALGVGTICGLINGMIVAYGNVPAFITTLGMQQVVRGMALLITNAKPVFGLSDTYTFLGNGKIFGVPVLAIVMLIVTVIFEFLLSCTKFGRHIYAVGGNELSAQISGLNVRKIKLLVYSCTGLLTGLAGLLLAGRIKSGTPTMGEGYELDAIAGAVIGGVSTTGGIGTVYGAVIGSLLMTMISNGLDLLNVTAYYQQIVKGAIIVLTVFVDVKTKKVKT